MRYDNLNVYKSSLNLAIYIEQIVPSFNKSNKYTLGEDLRSYSKKILFLIYKANKSKNKINILVKLIDIIEALKIIIEITKEVRGFKSFKQFIIISEMILDISKQTNLWFNYYKNEKIK
ncbi:MAG: four helix bundle protein [Campylobacterota bacterium]|nr:four helix bundle protein [Campylobacterota bacterium]